jgi:hypothetical protein
MKNIEENKDVNIIEQEIFEVVKDKVKNIYSKEIDSFIETEIRRRNYLKEDWQIGYSVDRIKEKVVEYLRYRDFKNKVSESKTKPKAVPAIAIVITIVLFIVAVLSVGSRYIFPISFLSFVASIGFIIKQRKEYNLFMKKMKHEDKLSHPKVIGKSQEDAE